MRFIGSFMPEQIPVSAGIKEALGDNGKVIYAKGANVTDDKGIVDFLNLYENAVQVDPRSPQEMIDEAVAAAKQSDVVVAVVGEAQGMAHEAQPGATRCFSVWTMASIRCSLSSGASGCAARRRPAFSTSSVSSVLGSLVVARASPTRAPRRASLVCWAGVTGAFKSSGMAQFLSMDLSAESITDFNGIYKMN